MGEEDFDTIEEQLSRRFSGCPLLLREFDFMKQLKKDKNFYKAVQLMDGTRTAVDISRDSGLAYAPLLDFIARLVESGYLVFVDDTMRGVYKKFGLAGLDAYNLINNKRTFAEIAESSGMGPEKLGELVDSFSNIENKAGVLRFKDEGTDKKTG